MRKLAFGKDPDDPEDLTEQRHEKFLRRLEKFEPTLAERGGPYVCGETFTYADLSAIALAVRLPQWTPHLVERVDALAAPRRLTCVVLQKS